MLAFKFARINIKYSQEKELCLKQFNRFLVKCSKKRPQVLPVNQIVRHKLV